MTEPINPYAPPQALEPLQLRPTSVGQPIFARPYESARGKTTALVWTTCIAILFQLVMVVSLLLQVSLLSGAQGGGSLDPAAANANDARHLIVTVLLVLSVIACLITLLVWVYATHANLPALGAKYLDFTPGWAVGWFFVPFMNLFKPYQAVSEIWHQSQPNSLLGRERIGASLVGWWWGLRIVSAIAERGLSSFSRHAETVDLLLATSWIAIVLTLLLDTPMMLCQILVARSIQKFQDERYELITAQQLASPPLPGESPFAARE